VPAVGESITEGTIARWLKKDGQRVETDEPVFELETDKATTAVPAPAAGVLHITVAEGKTVKIGAVVGEIDPAGKAGRGSRIEDRGSKIEGSSGETEYGRSGAFRRRCSVLGIASPAARVLAEEKGVATQSVPGTGRGGRVTKEDVVNFINPQPPPAPAVQEVKPPAAPPPSLPAPAPRGRKRGGV